MTTPPGRACDRPPRPAPGPCAPVVVSAPRAGQIAVTAARAPELVLVPCRPAVYDVETIAGTRDLVARFGANPPETVEGLRTETGCDVLAACGLSAVLFNQSADGTSRREAYRQVLHIGIRPVVRLMAAEFRAKLDAPGLEIDRSDLHTAGRIRSFKQLVEAGVDPVDAAEVTGITPDTTDSRPAAERAAGAGR